MITGIEHSAARRENESVVSQKRADTRANIISASRSGKVYELQSCLSQQGCLDEGVLDTALHVAVASGHAKCSEVLLLSGAHIDSKNMAGNTCMHVAASAGMQEMMKLLLDFEPSLNIRNADGKCAIALARNIGAKQLIAAEVKRRAEESEKRKRFQATLQSQSGSRGASLHHKRSPLAPRNSEQPPSPAPSHQSDKAPPADLLLCRVCLRNFCTERGTDPVGLPCGHTFCASCISGLRGTATRGAVAHSFRCPLDRQVFSRNLELRANAILQEVIPLLSSFPSSMPR
mmetsp:Transcript_10567/g.25008  ORF Transcript_10567/g.25008 Transcript_10567/m.25008 type:complete len:288 (-) Transcript_10567:835-1698(-)